MNGWSLAIINSHPTQYFAPLYRRLAADPDLDPTVYYCSPAGLDKFRDRGFQQDVTWDVPLLEGYEAKFPPNWRDLEQPAGFWSLINPGVGADLLEGRYDAVWLHGHNYATNVLAALAARTTGTALFMRCETHLGLDRPWWKRTVRGPVMSTFYRLFDACLAIGSRNADFYRAHGVDDDRIFLVPYTVDNDHFEEGARLDGSTRSEVRRELGLPAPDVPIVLFLSKLSKRKRPADLLEAFRRVRDRSEREMALAFVGAGERHSRLEAETESRDDVHFLGFRNQSELPRIYGACDLFVLPSENEPWGLVVNEAMASGLPVIASDEVGAAADLVEEGGNGFVYPCGDVDALADRMAVLLADAGARDCMGRRSREIIGDWDYGRCVRGLKQALVAACGARP